MLYAPAGFTKQDVALGDGEYCPAGHGKQLPFAARYVPALHGTHDVASALACEPDGHAEQATDAEVEATVKPGHRAHALAVLLRYVPAGHAVQAVLFTLLKYPDGHDVHATAEAAEKVPGPQLWHACSVAFKNVPAPHAT